MTPNHAQPIRVLHCPTDVGGNPQQLAQAERELGLASWSIVFQQSYVRYAADEVLSQPDDSRWHMEIKRWGVLWRAIRDYDIIHFNAGATIAPTYSAGVQAKLAQASPMVRLLYANYARLFYLRDVPLLKRLGKGIVVTYQGDDARQGDYSRKHFAITHANEVAPGHYTDEDDERRRRAIRLMARHADAIFALNPDLLHVLPEQAQFMPYASVDVRQWTPVPFNSDTNRPLVIVHAPTQRAVKGTQYVIEAVERLQAEGQPIEFVLVEKMSREEARRHYERADLLIDQLLAGWYGGLAVELMALGKPVICYIREEDLRFIPAEMRAEMPIINATPATLYEVL
ncbi:MAG: glycosyltransferase family 4 protein, partial [Chloroflexi bacterium]|nr:glycosyltransferase family 4 protein [Chloroflexota bacterium]